jgi:hypothetical protein
VHGPTSSNGTLQDKANRTAAIDATANACETLDMALIEIDKDARRLARAIASDISLYHEDKIVSGIEQDNLFEAMADELEEGRAHYKSRVAASLFEKNFYDRAIVDILVKSKGHVASKVW